MLINLCTLDGKVQEMDLDDGCTLTELQHQILKELKIPVECQKLVVGNEILTNTAEANKENMIDLRSRCDGNGRVSITVIFSIDGVCDLIQRHFYLFSHVTYARYDFEAVKGALNVIDGLGDTCMGNGQLLTTLVSLLVPQRYMDEGVTSMVGDVMLQALKLVSKIADTGNAEVISAVMGCLVHPSIKVRIAALKILPGVAGRGHNAAFREAMLCWRRDNVSNALLGWGRNREVTQAAFQALANLADHRLMNDLASITPAVEDQHLEACGLVGARLLRSLFDLGQ